MLVDCKRRDASKQVWINAVLQCEWQEKSQLKRGQSLLLREMEFQLLHWRMHKKDIAMV